MLSASIEDVFRRIVREELDAALRRAFERGGSPTAAAGAEFLTKEGAAALVQVGVGQIDSWLRKGALKKHGTGRAVRVARAELLALVMRGRPAPEGDVEARADELLGRKGRGRG